MGPPLQLCLKGGENKNASDPDDSATVGPPTGTDTEGGVCDVINLIHQFQHGNKQSTFKWANDNGEQQKKYVMCDNESGIMNN